MVSVLCQSAAISVVVAPVDDVGPVAAHEVRPSEAHETRLTSRVSRAHRETEGEVLLQAVLIARTNPMTVAVVTSGGRGRARLGTLHPTAAERLGVRGKREQADHHESEDATSMHRTSPSR